jgi:hypothetical protein
MAYIHTYTHIYIHTYTHTHTHLYIYIYLAGYDWCGCEGAGEMAAQSAYLVGEPSRTVNMSIRV